MAHCFRSRFATDVNFFQYPPTGISYTPPCSDGLRLERRKQAMAITAYLFYEDVGGALKWLAKAFDFPKYGARVAGPDWKIKHTALQFFPNMLMMGSPSPKYQ